jgi:hypothetical protein
VLDRALLNRAPDHSGRTVDVLDTNPAVTKSRDGTGDAAAPQRSAGAANRGVAMTAQLRIVGRRLPGSSWSGREGIHVGVQCGNDVVGLVTGDAADAVFDIELDVVAGSDGEVDFRGPYVNGRRGERFVYLAWGEVDDEGTFTMFRRLKLHLTPLLEQESPEKVAGAQRIQAILELTDTRGRPLAASVRPPWVTWRRGGGSRTSA